jgi:RNA recognition motif-containing protein
MRDPQGQSRGSGFVAYSSPEEATQAVRFERVTAIYFVSAVLLFLGVRGRISLPQHSGSIGKLFFQSCLFGSTLHELCVWNFFEVSKQSLFPESRVS